MKMNESAKKSIIQWVIAFTLIDILYFAKGYFDCITDPRLCYEVNYWAIFYIYGFPAGFMQQLSPNGTGWFSDITNAPVIGAALHLILGLAIGYLKRNKPFSWKHATTTAITVMLLLTFGLPAIFTIVSLFTQL